MKANLLAILAILLPPTPSAIAETQCDCTIYPFRPPACYGTCSNRIVNGHLSTSEVKDLDPKVADKLKEISKNPEHSKYDVSSIKDKSELDAFAAKIEKERKGF